MDLPNPSLTVSKACVCLNLLTLRVMQLGPLSLSIPGIVAIVVVVIVIAAVVAVAAVVVLLDF